MKYKIAALLFLFGIIFVSNFTRNKIYVSVYGNNNNDGSERKPFRTIQHAVDLAKPGTTVNILPGTYRESVIINKSGAEQKPIRIIGTSKNKNSIILSGAEPSSQMAWEKCSVKTCPTMPKSAQNSAYFTKLGWQEIPYLIYEIAPDGTIQQLQIARTPNFVEEPEGRYHKDWWTAEDSIDSTDTLTDKIDLKNLGDLTDASIYLTDGADRCGNFLYLKKVSKYDSINGIVYFANPVGFSIFGSQEKGIGPYTKYFIEGKPQLLDSPGEWIFDQKTKRLYIWPLENRNPAELSIEIGRRSSGIIIMRSNIEIDGISFRYINDNYGNSNSAAAIIISADPKNLIRSIFLKNIKIDYSAYGIKASTGDFTSQIDGVSIQNALISEINKGAIQFYSPDNESPNIKNIFVSRSEFHHIGRQNNSVVIGLARINNVSLQNNYIHDTASYGIHISGYERSSKEANNIMIARNKIRNVCMGTSSCSGIKLFGGKFKNTVVKNNIVSDNQGWSFCQEMTKGKGFAHGIFISNAEGITTDSNLIINNTGDGIHVYPRQIQARNNSITNNLLAYNSRGIGLTNPVDAHDYAEDVKRTRHDNTTIKNNVFLKNYLALYIDPANPMKLKSDYNAYIDNTIDLRYPENVVNATWDRNSITTAVASAFVKPENRNFNISYFSSLRGKGESLLSHTLFIGKILNLIGIGTDIGPCRFQWIGDSCPILRKE